MNFIRFFNQNRKMVIVGIVIAICVILTIQVLNNMAKNQIEKANNSYITTENSTQIIDKNSNTIQDESIIYGGSIGTQSATKNQELIKKFIDYCNNGKINEAYSMISYTCRDRVFGDINEFQEKYIKPIFSTKKEYSLQNWISTNLGNTYKVTYVEDILATGQISESIQDYITVLDDKQTINIFRYIDTININKSESNNVVSITVIDKDIYDEYEIYNIKVKNNSQNTIMINRNEDNGGIYVEYNGNKYSAIISEIASRDLTIEAGETKEISIKINKIYNEEYIAERMYFNDIINNKEEYDKFEITDAYTDISTLEIDL